MKKLIAFTSLVRRLKQLSRNRHPYEPLITVEISRERLLHNLEQFKKIAPNGIVAPVLKSNAYGHGFFEVANLLEKSVKDKKNRDFPFFVVDSYFEAVALRAQGIKTPILIVGYTRPETIVDSTLKNISFAVTSIDSLRALHELCSLHAVHKQHASNVSLHLKIDTGMRRQGILPAEIDEAITILKQNPKLKIDGAMTHFSDADNADHTFTEKQISVWNESALRIRHAFPSLRYLHASATDGHRFTEKIDANVSRLGLGLYGLSDDLNFTQKMNLQPVLSMKTTVTGVKQLKARESTGYGNDFVAKNDMTIATIPVGYFEGMSRKLSNNGSVTIEDTTCPIVGRISMNITTIEIPADVRVQIGTPVTVISNIASEVNSIASIAKKSGTVTYEIVVHIPAHLKRIVI